MVDMSGKVNVTIQAMQAVLKDQMADENATQEVSKEGYLARCAELVNPLASRLQANRKKIENRSSKVTKNVKSGEKGQELAKKKPLEDTAKEFENKNPGFKQELKYLKNLRDSIKPSFSKEQILETIRTFYQDPTLIDIAFQFLEETTDGELHLRIQEARNEFIDAGDNKREITAGHNIGVIARDTADKGLGTSEGLRDLYRDITGNPRDSNVLFNELSNSYTFQDLKKVVKFLLHSLGADLNSKGPSIEPGQLHRLIAETRSLQAILGVFNFFKGRMDLVIKQFAQNELDLPEQLTFEAAAKQFMSYVSDRYPSADKALQIAGKLGVQGSIIASIIVLSQQRDAIREVAPNQIFKSTQHRDDAHLGLIEALEDLEDELDKLSEEGIDEDIPVGRDDEDVNMDMS